MISTSSSYPNEHCQKAPELLRAAGVGDDMINSICSHGYGICADIPPEHLMDKLLFATDELTGLIGAAARMRPSKSGFSDMEVSSVPEKVQGPALCGGLLARDHQPRRGYAGLGHGYAV